ncbi:MAG: phosphocarrier protein HPr [Chlamydiae bacterium RIFCSPHIGHO2_12_FULL_49_11]|nr:MAG: phosphocarrier protein HPr [Chlamydiae bacterium RIFCSPHIGHO2_12_FULL_49_11]
MLHENRKKGSFVVLNEKGLHTRPATELVKAISKYKSNITLSYGGLSVNAKSLLGILMLAACRGARVKVEVTGDDAEACYDEILKLSKKKFMMHY